MVVKTAFGKEGDDKLGERVREQRGETQVRGRRHRGETPRWKVTGGGRRRQPANNAIWGNDRGDPGRQI